MEMVIFEAMKKIAGILFGIIVFSLGYSQIPNGYYDRAAGKTCAELKSALKYIITESHRPLPDDFLLAQYALTDVKPREVGSGSTTVIWDVYADNPNGPDPYNYNPSTQNLATITVKPIVIIKNIQYPKAGVMMTPLPKAITIM